MTRAKINRLAILPVAVMLVPLLLSVGCMGGGSSGAPDSGTGTTETVPETNSPPETTGETTAPDKVQLEQISSGTDGLKRPRVVVARSAGALSEATGVEVPDSGEGTYLAAFWGEKPTGGFTVDFLGVRRVEDRLEIRLALKKPPPDAVVTQALTYPYAAAVIRDGVPDDAGFALVTQGGRQLDWPVRRI